MALLQYAHILYMLVFEKKWTCSVLSRKICLVREVMHLTERSR
jgi:hypothetical protein